MKFLAITLALVGNFSTAFALSERVSFDDGWTFARFGKMPDGSQLAEPGSPAELVSVSSQEDKNPAKNAVDGNPETRWCAASEAKNQWLIYDLGAVANIGGVRVHWEKLNGNSFKIEISEDGKTWQEVVSKPSITVEKEDFLKSERARFARVTSDGSTANWVSIREFSVLDGRGEPITPKSANENGAPLKPQEIDFDDSAWRKINLPHDWAIEGPFRMEIENETGKLPWEGIGWYRKDFLTPETKNERHFIDFDGAMSQAKVYVNGQLAGEWAYGYTSFRVEITQFMKEKGINTVAVRLENAPQSTRWYPGAGIYRHVYLSSIPATAIAHWGVYVTTPQISDASASVQVATTVDNSTSQKARKVRVSEEILDGEAVLAFSSTEREISAGASEEIKSTLELKSPKRWELKSPHLYQIRTRIYEGDGLLDEKLTTFGVREISWNAQKGFLLNGKKVILKGVCQHHDLGPLGTAVHTRAIERQIEILMEMGVNSIRTAHNPPAPEFLELCDKMGILVIDELFDIWKLQKYGKTNGYNVFWDKWFEKDVRNFILRDRNHASIIAWSTGNEIPELGRPDMHWVPAKLQELIGKYDPTRPVTAGSNDPNAARNGFQKTVDVYGVNYHLNSYDATEKALPDMPLYASETSSAGSTRGEYFFPVSWDKSQGFFNFQVCSYDLYAPGWAYRPDLQFEALDKHPRFAGEYVWTGFDYLGEPTPYNQDQTNALNFQNPEERKKAMEQLEKLGNRAPSRSSYFGIVDLAGFKKDRFYLYQSRWLPDKPMAHILPHWNWPDRIGENVPVHVYTSGDEAELFLNGKSLGKRKKGDPHAYRLVWDEVKYEPGVLKVLVTKNGKPWAEDKQVTTGEATALEAETDRAEILADGRDLSYVTISAVDKSGNNVPRTRMLASISASGPIDLIGICNGDPTDFTTMKPLDPTKASIPIFNGLAQVIVRSRNGESGNGKLIITSEGLKSVDLVISTKNP